MLDIISCREDGSSAFDLGHLSLVTDDVAIPINLDYIQSLPQDLGIVISGYNMPEKRAEQSYASVVDGMEKAGLHLHWIGFTWPTGIGLSWITPDWTKLFSRNKEKSEVMTRASNSGHMLRLFMLLLTVYGKRVRLIQTHSLGARVALKALSGGSVYAHNLILSAPAVDADSLELNKEFVGALGSVGSLAIACSVNDGVLKKMYRFANAGFDKALGYSGPKNINATPPFVRTFDFSALVKDHSAYRLVPEYYEVCAAVVNNTASPDRYNVVNPKV